MEATLARARSRSASDFVLPVSHGEAWAAPENAAVVQNEVAQAGSTTFLRTCLNGLNALLGVGLLSVPYALSQSGWLSLALLAVVSAVCFYTSVLLKRCMAADPAIRTYPAIGERAFGRYGRLIMSAFMYVELYFAAVSFLILEGDNLYKLFPGTSVSLGPVTIARKQLFVVLVALLIMPTTWLRSLNVLAYVSLTGVFSSIIITLCVLWAAVFDGVGFRGQGTSLLRFNGLPTALGLYIFCYAGHPVFPTLYSSMNDKSQFSKMLVVCFALCTLNYCSMGVLGYLMYGDDLQSQVTLNLPAVKLSAKIAIYTTLVNPLSKYSLVVMPIATSIEERMGAGAVVAVVVRTVLVLSTMVVAMAVPYFAYLMALVGSLVNVSACMLLPCICYLNIFGASKNRMVELATIAAILVLGPLVAVTGTYSSLRQIVHEL